MITREQRRELAVDLRSGGLSTRAIGAVLGVGYDTVQRDLKAGDRNRSPEIENHRSGVTNVPTADVDQNRAKLAEIDNGLGIVPDRIMGADGKSYASSRTKPVDVVDAEIVDDEPDQDPEPTPEPKVMLSHEVVADEALDDERPRRTGRGVVVGCYTERVGAYTNPCSAAMRSARSDPPGAG